VSNKLEDLKKRIKELESENKILKKGITNFLASGNTVKVPPQLQEVFTSAEETVKRYFKELKVSPSKGRIEINGERYVLLRASSLSFDFLNKIKDLYADKGEKEAYLIGRNFLFDIAHVLGLEDAKKFHSKMKLKTSISKLSAGPIHFAYTGWASVEILPESKPSPDDNFYLKYRHPYSFEADSWLRAGVKSDYPVCVMNSGYSSGWCEESYGIPLTAVEITCKAKGDENCTFVMAPPHKINAYLPEIDTKDTGAEAYDVPLFFERKRAEEKIKNSLKEKEILLKEVHHRVKNNLQIISSLLNLQSYYLIDDKSKSLFKETQNRIKTLALVHEKLYKSEDVEYVDIGQYITSIVELLSYSYDKENITVNYNFNFENLEKFDIEKAIPCGLIINEIISNAYKYAFPKKRAGTISVELSKTENSCVLIIQDNGIGMPKDIDVNNSETLGLELINSLVEQLEGTLTVNNQKGTKYLLEFPY
jgi:two-component sensor histidine kinase/predicted hydrocarbon binding protein